MPPAGRQRSMVSAQLSKTNKGVDDENYNPVILPEGILHPIQGGMRWVFNFSILLFNGQAELCCRKA